MTSLCYGNCKLVEKLKEHNMFKLLLSNGNDMNKRTEEINFHSTKSQKEKHCHSIALKIVLPQLLFLPVLVAPTLSKLLPLIKIRQDILTVAVRVRVRVYLHSIDPSWG
jgi:hypothetical protein